MKKDIEARAHMLAASQMGSTAFQKGLGAIHSLSHPIGSLYHTHHGMTNAVFMPYVLAFNRAAVAERLGRLAGYLGLAPTFDAFAQWVLDLRASVGVPHTLAGLKVDGARAELIADMAIVDPTAGGNPVEITRDAALKIFDAALTGRVG